MRWVVFWAVAGLLSLSGCDRTERPAGPAAAAFDDQTPRSGGVLLRRLDSDINTLNPVTAVDRYDRLVNQYLFTPLLYLDQELRPVSGLAESWEISPDGKKYTFRLFKNATWSDGKPVRAADVVFTLRKVLDPQSEAAQIASGFEQLDQNKTRAVDDHTVEVVFRDALASQLYQFAAPSLYILPEHVYGSGSFRADFNDKAVGSGPYTLVRRLPGKEVVLQKRPDYWGRKPYIDTVIFKVIVNDTTAWNAINLGQIDETIVPSEIWGREQNNPRVTSKIAFLRYYGLTYNYIGWNGRNPLFADARTRQALSMCLDVPGIIKNLYAGTARPVNGHFLPEQWAFNPEVEMIRHDPAAARQTLTSMGWLDTDGDGVLDKGGRPFRFELLIMSGSATAAAIAQSFQASLQQVGIAVEIAVVDFAAAFDRILAGNFEAAYLSWDLDPDPDVFPLFHASQVPPRGQNYVHYANPAANELIQQGRREINLDKRIAIYQQLHVRLAEDQPYTWVVQPSIKWAVRKRLRGVKLGKGFGLTLWHPGELDWWLADSPR